MDQLLATRANDIIMVPLERRSLAIAITSESKPHLRMQLQALARNADFEADVSGNQSTTAYTLGGTVGGALATGGILAMVTSSNPISIAAAAVVGVGILLTVSGVWVGHWLSNVQASYRRDAVRYKDAIEDMDR